jgi:cell pole-organizing protein PopZ
MTQAAKAQEPSMEEILASIRRIIADDDGSKPKVEAKPEPKPEPPAAKVPPKPAPPPAPPPPAPVGAAMGQDDIDAMLAGLDEPAAEPPPPPPPPPPPEEDVLELTEAMQAPAAPGFRTIEAHQDVVFEEAADPEPPPRRRPDPPRPAPPSRPSPLAETDIMSSATAAAVDSAFNALAHTVLVQNAKTLEDLVKEMLRPMLQHWLDNNLPTLVERLVRQEIERVARGRNS